VSHAFDLPSLDRNFHCTARPQSLPRRRRRRRARSHS
jgi:hypothetical protein